MIPYTDFMLEIDAGDVKKDLSDISDNDQISWMVKLVEDEGEKGKDHTNPPTTNGPNASTNNSQED